MQNPITKMRQLWDCPIFIMGIVILVRMFLILSRSPTSLHTKSRGLKHHSGLFLWTNWWHWLRCFLFGNKSLPKLMMTKFIDLNMCHSAAMSLLSCILAWYHILFIIMLYMVYHLSTPQLCLLSVGVLCGLKCSSLFLKYVMNFKQYSPYIISVMVTGVEVFYQNSVDPSYLPGAPFIKYGLTLIAAWKRNHIHYGMWE